MAQEGEKMYSLDKEVKSLAIANDFVVTTNKACYKLGDELTPFCICGSDLQKEWCVPDFAEFGGCVNQDVNLMTDIATERAKVYLQTGIRTTPEMNRLLFFDYLLTVSVCYVEVPKWVTKNGIPQESFDKFLCTRNPALMAAWMGASTSEMQARYSAKIRCTQADFEHGELRMVRLNHSGKGNSISVPRGTFSAESMTCIPLYMLYAWIEGMRGHLEEGLVKFTFAKDNGTVRELVSTLNPQILMDVYNDNNFVSSMLSMVDINTVQQGGMMLPGMIHRGFIRVPEVGASIYDGTGVRAVNVARLLDVAPIDIKDVDLSFVNVDLSSAVANFDDAIDYLIKISPSSLRDCFIALVEQEPSVSEPIAIAGAIKDYASGGQLVMTTTFNRELHSFMVSHPEWFPLYTGKPNASVVKSNVDDGLLPLDF